MVYSVTEPYLFEVFLEGEEILVFAVSFVGCVDCFENGTQHEVGLAVLIPKDVASVEGCLYQIVHEQFLV